LNYDELIKKTSKMVSFLTDSPYFIFDDKNSFHGESISYFFQEEKEGMVYEGFIYVPINENYELNWAFRTFRIENSIYQILEKEFEDFNETPKWFHELIPPVAEMIQKRDRVRQLFIKEKQG